MLFDRNITDGRAMMCSILTLTIGNNQGMGDVEYGKIYDIYFPPPYLRLFDGPSCSVLDMWRILGRGTKDGGLVVGTIIQPQLGLQTSRRLISPTSSLMDECIPEVAEAVRACVTDILRPTAEAGSESIDGSDDDFLLQQCSGNT